MESYGEYASLLNNALQEKGEEIMSERNAFTEAVSSVEEIKSKIEMAGDFASPLGLGISAPQITRATKILGLRAKQAYENFTQGDNLSEGGDTVARGNVQEQIMEQDPENSITEGRISNQTQATESTDSTVSNTVTDATPSADATTTATETGLQTTEEASAAAAEETAELTADSVLMDNPFTFLIGLIAFAGILGGTMGGAESIKNPTVPKPPPIANVSTQFGIGS